MAIARFMASKSVRLPTLIEPSVRPRPVNNRGSSPVPDWTEASNLNADIPGSGLGRIPGPGEPVEMRVPISTETPKPSGSRLGSALHRAARPVRA